MPEFASGLKYQAVIFTPDLMIGSAAGFARRVKELIKDRFTAVNLVTNTPQEAPPEIPRVVCLGTEPGWTLQISLVRTDLVYDPFVPLATDLPPVAFGDFVARATEILSRMQVGLELTVDRIALIYEEIDRVSEGEAGSPADYVVTRFASPEITSRGNVEEAEVHWLRHVDLGGRKVNCWTRIKSVEVAKAPHSGRKLLLHFDFNTLPQDRTPFDAKAIALFFESIQALKEEMRGQVLGG